MRKTLCFVACAVIAAAPLAASAAAATGFRNNAARSGRYAVH
jgi:hypothetical protein